MALLYAAVNMASGIRRAPIMRRQARDLDEKAVQHAADWLQKQLPHSHILLLLSRKDLKPEWYRYRLNYFIYPLRLSIARDALPGGVESRYDLVLAYGSAQALIPSTWEVIARVEQATLAAPRAPPFPIEKLPSRSREKRPSLLNLLVGLFSLAVVIGLGALLLGITVPKRTFSAWWANAALAHLVGATALTWVLVLVTVTTGRLRVWPIYVLLLCLLPAWQQAVSWLFPKPSPSVSLGRMHRWEWGAVLLIAAGIFSALWNGWMLGLGWDGWAIWQFKAKAFFVDGNLSILRDTARYGYAHMDYPLLVPLQTWWTYTHLGAVSEHWAQVVNFLFYLDVLAIFTAMAYRYLPRPYVLIGLAFLATLPIMSGHATSGFADMPFTAYLLTMGVCLVFLFVEGDRSQIPLLAWWFAGLPLTKNEGLLACLSGLGVGVVYGWRNRHIGRVLVLWMAASIVAYLPWHFVKRAWHLTSDILEPEHPVRLTAGLLAWRLGYTLWGFVKELLHLGPRAPSWGLVVFLLPTGLWMSCHRRVAVAGPLWLLAFFQGLGYIGVYLITPHPLAQHMATSAGRLLLHLMPLTMLGAQLGCFAGRTRKE
jgi:hypothetical protein